MYVTVTELCQETSNHKARKACPLYLTRTGCNSLIDSLLIFSEGVRYSVLPHMVHQLRVFKKLRFPNRKCE